MNDRPLDRALAIAARQHGALSLAQARAAGMAATLVRQQVDSGRWARIARGVVIVVGSPPTWDQRAMAALLARPDAHLGELAAGHAHGLVDAPLDEPTLIVPRGTSSRAPLGRVRRLELPEGHRTLVRGLRATSVARTLVDLGGVVPRAQLAKLVDEAIGARRATPLALAEVCDAAGHVPLAARRTVLEAASIWEGIRPGSIGEVRLLRSIDEWELPPPDRQIRILDRTGAVVARVDTGWAAARLGLEYDSVEWHGPARWMDDEARHQLVEQLGWTLLHVGARDLLPSSDLRRRLQRQLAARALPLPAA
ncbi:MAG: type IV toxin-antitoxin system AbiEi family antitoxin domain-containing protein [Acidimicrobiales bacterium]